MKLLVWGTGNLAECCINDLTQGNEIIAFVESEKNKEEFKQFKVIGGNDINRFEYDYIILANTHEDEIIEKFALDKSKVIEYRKYIDDISPCIFKTSFYAGIFKYVSLVSLEYDNTEILFSRNDRTLFNDMIRGEEIWEKQAMQFLVDNCDLNNNNKFYIEVGGNIGTQCCWLSKRIGAKSIVFEPMKNNYKMLKINCLLNDVDNIILEKMSVSDNDGRIKMYSCPNNSGGSSSEYIMKNAIMEEVRTVRLDSYFDNNQILYDAVAAMWMDIEGHEPQAIHGMKKILKASDLILYMEFNPSIYLKKHTYEMILTDLKECFNRFLCWELYKQGDVRKRDIEEIDNIADETNYQQINLFLMK